MGIAALWGTGKCGGEGDSSLVGVGVGVGVGGFVGLPACVCGG